MEQSRELRLQMAREANQDRLRDELAMKECDTALGVAVHLFWPEEVRLGDRAMIEAATQFLEQLGWRVSWADRGKKVRDKTTFWNPKPPIVTALYKRDAPFET